MSKVYNLCPIVMIVCLIVGILQLTEAIHFFIKYEENREDFFLTGERFRYGPGFAITIAGGVSLLICAILGCIIFCTVCRKMLRLSNGDAKVYQIIIPYVLVTLRTTIKTLCSMF